MFEERIAAIYRDLVPEHLADVNRLNQQTRVHQIVNLQGGGWTERLNQGYASVIDTFGLLHGYQVTPRARTALSQMADMLRQNSKDEIRFRPLMTGARSADADAQQSAWEAARQHADEKVSELYAQGKTLIISGNTTHATIVRLRRDEQGDIICSTYNASNLPFAN